MGDQGLILFAHGAPDLRSAEPFERLLGRVQEGRPDTAATLAFLEHIAPDVATAAGQLAARVVRRLRVVPLFFGCGGHPREDFPLLVQKAREAAPDVAFEIAPAAGEDAALGEALADFALAGME